MGRAAGSSSSDLPKIKVHTGGPSAGVVSGRNGSDRRGNVDRRRIRSVPNSALHHRSFSSRPGRTGEEPAKSGETSPVTTLTIAAFKRVGEHGFSAVVAAGVRKSQCDDSCGQRYDFPDACLPTMIRNPDPDTADQGNRAAKNALSAAWNASGFSMWET